MLKKLLARQEGATTIEMTFFVVIFSLLFFGGAEMARVISVKHALDVGVANATRVLALNPTDTATAQATINSELANNVLGAPTCGTGCMTIDYPDGTIPPLFQKRITVVASVSYQPAIPFMVWAPKTLTVSHTQRIEAYP
jgi:Flp pilus assembly protein TadG